jgi:hypothetical protein
LYMVNDNEQSDPGQKTKCRRVIREAAVVKKKLKSSNVVKKLMPRDSPPLVRQQQARNPHVLTCALTE